MKAHYARNAGVASLAGLAALANCSSEEKKYSQWMETPGMANRINLDDVRNALENSKGVSEFETRVNEIYEGPHRVLIEIKETDDGKKKLSGYEDTNDDKRLDTESDFLLFSTTIGDESYEMRGGGAHSYYHHTGHYPGGGGFLMGYLMGSAFSGPMYVTPRRRVDEIDSHRRTYRSSPAYRQQTNRNMAFRKAQLTKNPNAAKGFRSKVSTRSYRSSSRRSSRFGGFRSGS
ncbi:MAG: hypothetical protein GF344_06670 [Chitinivibrionales bacterium]|nr:hypothetical protein [Chitinivibrionales bacterium]MBD3356610.1 hypothetical protein [Chitinivibrionales bacterium]